MKKLTTSWKVCIATVIGSVVLPISAMIHFWIHRASEIMFIAGGMSERSAGITADICAITSICASITVAVFLVVSCFESGCHRRRLDS